MRRFAVWVFASLLMAGMAVVPPGVRAGDCPGMTDYTYENGQCEDVSPDFYAPLERSAGEEFTTQHDMFQGAREWNHRTFGSGGPGFAGGGGMNNARIEQYVRALFNHVSLGALSTPIYPRLLASALARHNAKRQQQYAKMFTQALHDFNAAVPPQDAPMHNVILARLYAITYAYHVYNGYQFNRSDLLLTSWALQFNAAIDGRMASLSRKQLQMQYEYFATWGGIIGDMDDEATRKHDRSEKLVARRVAYTFIRRDLGVDPDQVPPYKLVCLTPIINKGDAMFGCDWVVNNWRRILH